MDQNKMDPLAFCYWLQGYVEIAANRTAPTSDEWQVIKDHLDTVFTKVTPNRNLGTGVASNALATTNAAPTVNSVEDTPQLDKQLSVEHLAQAILYGGNHRLFCGAP